MKIAIIDYGAGNVQSVLFALERLGFEGIVTNDWNTIKTADKVIFPGVGEASSAMKMLVDSGLDVLIPTLKQPVLGICLGMQLLTKGSEEGVEKGLSWVDAQTVKFNFSDKVLKIPHMGWSYIDVKKENALIRKEDKHRFYFVHSYYVKCTDESQSLATSNFGFDFTCMVNKDNIFGAQFHPEKSLKFGMKLLENFSKL